MPAELNVDYVSPLPPVRSGIADYSVDLLSAIEDLPREDLHIRVVRVPDQDVDDALVARWRPVDLVEMCRHYRGPSPDSEGTVSAHGPGLLGSVPVYHLGNNTYHEAIYEAALECPGIVVLHDVFLHHLMQERTLAKGDVPSYVRQLSRDHGWVGGAVSLPPRWSGYGQAGLFALPAHRTLLQEQRGVIVHSAWAKRFLHEEGIDRPVVRVPMVMPLPELSEELEDRANFLRSKWGIAKRSFVLGSFGFQTPIKRTSTAIHALAQPGLENVELVVGGQMAKELDLEALAQELGVEDRVHLIGFLTANDFSAAIRACHLIVNLRYPTAGETSASLLRVLALGRGAVVSDYAQFRDFSEEFVLRLPLGSDPGTTSAEGEEVLALAESLRSLMREPEKVAAMGNAAREFVAEHHAPLKAAQAFVDAVAQLGRESLPPSMEDEALSEVGASARIPRPSTLTWGRLESALRVEGVKGWQPGERRAIRLVLENHSFARFLSAERGEGGVMIEVRLLETSPEGTVTDVLAGRPWLGLPRDLMPGDACVVEVRLRRPLGPTEMLVEPHVVGGQGFAQCRGAFYSERFD